MVVKNVLDLHQKDVGNLTRHDCVDDKHPFSKVAQSALNVRNEIDIFSQMNEGAKLVIDRGDARNQIALFQNDIRTSEETFEDRRNPPTMIDNMKGSYDSDDNDHSNGSNDSDDSNDSGDSDNSDNSDNSDDSDDSDSSSESSSESSSDDESDSDVE